MVRKGGQKRETAALICFALKACQTFATTTGTAIRTTAICGGNTKAIKGTVSKGVPTPNAPLMSPPKNRAMPHQPTINQSASVIRILFL